MPNTLAPAGLGNRNSYVALPCGACAKVPVTTAFGSAGRVVGSKMRVTLISTGSVVTLSGLATATRSRNSVELAVTLVAGATGAMDNEALLTWKSGLGGA